MNISPKTYARALLESLEGVKNEKAAIERFVRLVSKTGGPRKLRTVLSAVQAAAVKKGGGRMIIGEIARPFTKKQEQELRGLFSSKDHLEFVIRPELIAGIRIVIDGEQAIDSTLKRKIETLFTSN